MKMGGIGKCTLLLIIVVGDLNDLIVIVVVNDHQYSLKNHGIDLSFS